jgi:hypothetical protein
MYSKKWMNQLYPHDAWRGSQKIFCCRLNVALITKYVLVNSFNPFSELFVKYENYC